MKKERKKKLENIFWKKYSSCEKAYILTGDSKASLDLSQYQESSYINEEEFPLEDYQQLPAQQVVFPKEYPTLYFEPPTSSKESKESDAPESVSYQILYTFIICLI
jgi:hypothetical protein